MTRVAVRIGFLRAINLGAKRKFPKDAVARSTEAAGFTGVATHLNTGNVRFETSMRSRTRIEAALEAAYEAEAGFEVPTVVFTPDELRAVAEEAGRLGRELGGEGRHYVSLLKDEPSAEAVRAVEARSSAGEVARVGGRAVHLLLGENYHEARLTNAVVERHLGVATNRNLTVICALVDKWC
ncbi:DUF1697 domain-containing protein [Nocardioides flavescens]|uniref:DUF1697 domain-containing protein n=1 Tax=Nocardioides flavescens TaxID=2691959 RepID=UPI001928F8F8|nr:DUF1697 domain-containing protein [Nocardioides flavescens]